MEIESFEHRFTQGHLLLFNFSMQTLDRSRRTKLIRFLGSLGLCMVGAGSVLVQDSIPLSTLQERLNLLLTDGEGVLVVPLSGHDLSAMFLSKPKPREGMSQDELDCIEQYRRMTPEERSSRFRRTPPPDA